MKRREFIKSGLALAGFAAISDFTLRQAAAEDGFDYVLIAEPSDVSIIPGTVTPALTFNGMAPGPVLRARQGERFRVKLVNKLPQDTTIHWHGIRIDNKMDGVPFLTQKPIMPGETFVYDFTPPDAGTFWYHPHSHSIEQLSKGLVGLLIVEEKETPGFDADIPLVLKKWRLKDDGQFLQLSKPRGAARAGTPGTRQTVNDRLCSVIKDLNYEARARPQTTYEIPAGGSIRVRLANLDNTVTYNCKIDTEQVYHISYDGMPLSEPREQMDFPIGAGMRIDAAFIAPKKVGQEIMVFNETGMGREPLCTFKTVASKLNRTELPKLPSNSIPLPDTGIAEIISFSFDWSASIGRVRNNDFPSFWAINRTPWQGSSEDYIPPPLATLELGKHYIFELKNTNQYKHPIHLHGIEFTVLKRSNRKNHIPYQADTILMDDYEKAYLGFVADNPGKWMFHCHVVEHMRSGLMGYIEIV